MPGFLNIIHHPGDSLSPARNHAPIRNQRGELRTTRQTFGAWFDEWLQSHHTISKATREDYRQMLRESM